MKTPDIDWRSFLDAVELYQRLPPGARRFFARKLSGAASQVPAPVAVCGDFHSPFLMEDMTAILSASTVEP